MRGRKENIERIKRELVSEGFRVENNPTSISYDTQLIVGEIDSLSKNLSDEIESLSKNLSDEIKSLSKNLSDKVIYIGLGIIGIIAAFGVALMSAL